MRSPLTFFLAFALTASAVLASNVGRVFPSEKRTYTDAVTGLTVNVLTTDDANDAKP